MGNAVVTIISNRKKLSLVAILRTYNVFWENYKKMNKEEDYCY